MTTPFSSFGETKNRIVYVRPVQISDLPEDVRAQVGEQLGDEGIVYSVHTQDGQRLAFVADRNLAFQLARSNDFAPHSVH